MLAVLMITPRWPTSSGSVCAICSEAIAVDHRAQRAPAAGDQLDGMSHVGRVGDIGLDVLDSTRPRGGVDADSEVEREDLRALLDQGPRCRGTQAGGPTRDDCGGVVELHSGLLLDCRDRAPIG